MIPIDTLIDAFIALFYDCKTIPYPSQQVHRFITKYNQTILHLENKRQKLNDFDIIKTFATGSLGKVCLVKSKSDSGYYAMKILRKSDLLTRREAAFFMEERDSMILGRNSKWLTRLYMSFQDQFNLYLLMEFVPGGSLKTLIDSSEEPMNEKDALFYVIEMILAIEQVHSLGFIHRDIKPDNFLIDIHGHLKITDFGSCIRMQDANDTSIMQETVGTPDYICPEILRAHEGSIKLDETCDWWSLGIVAYELLFDEVPFYAETLVETYARIMEHSKYFSFPTGIEISKHASDFISNLITQQPDRLGKNGIQEIKAHSWFQGVSWDQGTGPPPFVPDLNGPEDTKYFDNEELDPDILTEKKLMKPKEFAGQHLPFIGYTCLEDEKDLFQGSVQGLNKLYRIHESPTDSKMQDLNKSIQDLTPKLQDTQDTINQLESDKLSLSSQLQRLQLDINIKHLEVQECENKIQKLETDLQESKSIQEYEKVSEQYDLLYSQHQQLLDNSKQQQEELSRLKEKLSSTVGQLNLRESEVDLFKNQYTQQQDKLQQVQTEFEKLNQHFIHQSSSLQDKETEIQRLQNQIQKLNSDIREVQIENTKSNLQVKELQIVNFTLEKSLASMDVKDKQSQIKIESQMQDIESLKSKVDAFISQDHSKEIISNLSTEMESIQTSKARLQEECNQLKQIQVQQNLELEKTSNLLSLEVENHVVTKESKLEYQNKLQETVLTVNFYSSKIEQLESQLATSGNRIQSLKQCLKLENETVKSFDVKLKTQQDAFSQLQLSLDTLKSQLKTETMEKMAIKDKFELNEKVIQEYKKKREALESQFNVNQSHKDNVLKENDILKQRMNIIMKQYDSLLSEKQSLALSNKQELDDLQSRYHQELSKRGNLENIKSTMTRLVKDLEEAAKKETEKRLDLEHLLEMSRQKVDYLESQLANCNSKSQEDHPSSHHSRKLEDSHSSLAKRVKPIDYSPDRQSLIFTPRKSIRSSFMNLFKGHVIKTLDYEEDSDSRRERSQSVDTCSRSMISMIPEFDGSLKGWLKVPKGGKLRKGWIEKFFIIQDYKLYEFDKEKDVEFMNGKMIADIRSIIFIAKPVSPNEVIHVNSRDVFSIFKIQTSSEPYHSSTKPESMQSIQPTQTIQPPETKTNLHNLKKKIIRLESELNLEVKMEQAAQKILSVTKENQKHSILTQLDSYAKRIQMLESDLQESTNLIKNLSLENQENASQTDGVDSDARHDQPNKETIESLKRELTAQIELEYKKKDALHKFEQTKYNKSLHSKSNNTAYMDELYVIDRAIIKLKDTRQVLDSNNTQEINKILQKYEYSMTHLGHEFKVKQFYTISDCSVCHETLWGNKNQGLECQLCKDICHKTCMPLIDIPCQDVVYLKSIPTMYFLAKDSQDKSRWLYGLNHYKRELQIKKS